MGEREGGGGGQGRVASFVSRAVRKMGAWLVLASRWRRDTTTQTRNARHEFVFGQCDGNERRQVVQNGSLVVTIRDMAVLGDLARRLREPWLVPGPQSAPRRDPSIVAAVQASVQASPHTSTSASEGHLQLGHVRVHRIVRIETAACGLGSATPPTSFSRRPPAAPEFCDWIADVVRF